MDSPSQITRRQLAVVVRSTCCTCVHQPAAAGRPNALRACPTGKQASGRVSHLDASQGGGTPTVGVLGWGSELAWPQLVSVVVWLQHRVGHQRGYGEPATEPEP